eukprot:TRINITY_DN13734_c0_g1_i5.p1 TRINITY_DN13734_c0_g1~~TRINITY_DN13734_c0_g1_i5.p1  ORF type:complete len:205 (+),score=40.09 TRINITY_DN13734_c0_g1_i5:55-669(+)
MAEKQKDQLVRRSKAIELLSAALRDFAGSAESKARLDHPWACEFLAWRLEGLLFAEDVAGGATGATGSPYLVRTRSLLKGLRLIDNGEFVTALLSGQISPAQFLEIELAGKLLPADQQRRIAEEAEEAATRRRKEQEAVMREVTNLRPHTSIQIQCPSCEAWGARYGRMPHAARGNRAERSALSARISCECLSCGNEWKADEPP